MNTQALEDAIEASRLDHRSLARCGDMARVLMESRTLRENVRGAVERLGYPNDGVGRSLLDESRLRAATMIALAERVLSDAGIEYGQTAEDAADVWRAIMRVGGRT
jgi:hypothetical protein